MTSSYYDVAVLGTRLEPLVCAALLAKRGLRVLVVGQGEHEPTYEVNDYRLPRDPFPYVGGSSPQVERVVESLGLRQAVRQRIRPREPAMQALVEGHRFDLYVEDAPFRREVQREFPEVRRQSDDLRRTLHKVNAELDELMRRPLSWPPETFVERQRLARALSMQRYNRSGRGWHPVQTLPRNHPFADTLRLALPFLCDLTPSQTGDFAATRLLGQLFNTPGPLAGGWAWLREALIERIRALSGDVRPLERASEIAIARGAVRGVTLARSGEEVGCGHLVLGTTVAELLQLVSDRAPILELFERVGEPRLHSFRYTLNVVVGRRAIPEAWRADLLLKKSDEDAQGITLWIEPHTEASDEYVILCAGALVPSHAVDEVSYTLETYRGRVMDALRSVLPFVDRDLLLVDSPHDGLPPQGTLEPTRPWNRGPQTMRPIYEYPERAGLGACGLPARTPIKGLLLCNPQVVPGLGLEGAFLAASSVSRLIGRRYRGQDWIRRGLWSADSVAI